MNSLQNSMFLLLLSCFPPSFLINQLMNTKRDTDRRDGKGNKGNKRSNPTKNDTAYGSSFFVIVILFCTLLLLVLSPQGSQQDLWTGNNFDEQGKETWRYSPIEDEVLKRLSGLETCLMKRLEQQGDEDIKRSRKSGGETKEVNRVDFMIRLQDPKNRTWWKRITQRSPGLTAWEVYSTCCSSCHHHRSSWKRIKLDVDVSHVSSHDSLLRPVLCPEDEVQRNREDEEEEREENLMRMKDDDSINREKMI